VNHRGRRSVCARVGPTLRVELGGEDVRGGEAVRVHPPPCGLPGTRGVRIQSVRGGMCRARRRRREPARVCGGGRLHRD
jgi:hypothetical protein